MITAAILKMLVFVLTGVMSLLPTIEPPSWLSGSGSSVDKIFQDAGLMSVWFPVQLATTVLTGVVVIWLAGFAVKAARIVVSLLSGGGGSAA